MSSESFLGSSNEWLLYDGLKILKFNAANEWCLYGWERVFDGHKPSRTDEGYDYYKQAGILRHYHEYVKGNGNIEDGIFGLRLPCGRRIHISFEVFKAAGENWWVPFESIIDPPMRYAFCDFMFDYVRLRKEKENG